MVDAARAVAGAIGGHFMDTFALRVAAPFPPSVVDDMVAVPDAAPSTAIAGRAQLMDLVPVPATLESFLDIDGWPP